MIQNPWAGLASYQDPAGGSTLLFCGRDNESYDLAALVDDNIFCTLYGKSGTGKTSLLNAGMFPRLRDMGYLPLSIRLGMEALGSTFQQCIVSRLGQVATLQASDAVPLPADDQDEQWLWAWFARTRFVDGDGKVRFPVLVFDQFEEVFRGRRTEAETLLRQVHFMMDPSHTLGDDYDYNFRFLASIREDDLYLLEDSLDRNFMGDMKQCRYRLNALSDEGAREVILKPGKGLFSESEQDAIVDTVIGIARSADGSINTNILSLVCSRIYDHYQRSGDESISLDLVKRFVSSNPFEQFYNEVTASLGEKEKQFIEDRLVDAAGRRGSVSEPDFEKNVPNGAHLLEGTGRILQRVASGTEGRSYRIELIHDSFCAPLADQKMKRAARRRRRITIAVSILALIVAAVAAYIVIMSIRNARQTREILIQQEKFYAKQASQLLDEGDTYTALLLLNELTDPTGPFAKIPLQPEAECQMRRAVQMHDEAEWQVECVYLTRGPFYEDPQISPNGKYLITMSFDDINVHDYATGSFITRIVSGYHFNYSYDTRMFEISQDEKSILWLSPYYTNKLLLFDIETGSVQKTIDIKTSVSKGADIYAFTLSGPHAIVRLGSVCVYDEYGELIIDTAIDCIKSFDMYTNNLSQKGFEYEESSCIDEFCSTRDGRYLISRKSSNGNNNVEMLIHDNSTRKLVYKFRMDKDVLSWTCLTNDKILLVKKNALYVHDISKKETYRVIDKEYDLKLIEFPLASKDKFIVSNGDTVFIYNINDYSLDAYYIFDHKKYTQIYLSYNDNCLLLANQSKGTIYRLRHNPHYKKDALFPELAGNYTIPLREDTYDEYGNKIEFDTNSLSKINKGWYWWSPSSGVAFFNDVLLGVGDDGNSLYDIENDLTIKTIEGWFLSISPDGQHILGIRKTGGYVFNTKKNTEKNIPDTLLPLFFDYNGDIYCKHSKTGKQKSTPSEYDTLFRYSIAYDTAEFCMKIRSLYRINSYVSKVSSPDKRYYGFSISEDSIDAIRYVILDTKRKKLYQTQTYFYDAKITSDGYILTSEPDGYLKLRKVTDFTVIDKSLSRTSQIKAISPDGQYAIVYPDNSNVMELWGIHPLRYLSSHTCPIFSYSEVKIFFKEDGKSVIVFPDIYNIDGRILHGQIQIPSQQEIIEATRVRANGRKLTDEEKNLLME